MFSPVSAAEFREKPSVTEGTDAGEAVRCLVLMMLPMEHLIMAK